MSHWLIKLASLMISFNPNHILEAFISNFRWIYPQYFLFLIQCYQTLIFIFHFLQIQQEHFILIFNNFLVFIYLFTVRYQYFIQWIHQVCCFLTRSLVQFFVFFLISFHHFFYLAIRYFSISIIFKNLSFNLFHRFHLLPILTYSCHYKLKIAI